MVILPEISIPQPASWPSGVALLRPADEEPNDRRDGLLLCQLMHLRYFFQILIRGG